MSFAMSEISNYGAKPALLFVFTRGAQVYRYTAADRSLTVGGNTFTAHPIKCGEFRFTGDAQADELTITAPASLPFVQDFVLTPPQERLGLSVMRYHVGSAPAVRWSGFVDRIVQMSKTKASIIGTSLLAGLQNNGVRLIWQRQCPHAIYSPGCGVNKAAFAVTGVVEALSGTGVVAAGFTAAGEGRLAAGFVEWTTAAGHTMRRVINQHGTNFIEVLGGTRGMAVGMTVVAYPGCPRTPEGCALFNNQPNYGGFRHIPSRSPFDGNPVF